MEMKNIIILLTGFALISSCKSQHNPARHTETAQTIEVSQIADGANYFGFNLFKEISSADKSGENIFISPLSAHLAMTMAWNGAGGTTGEQMAEALRYQHAEAQSVNKSYRQFLNDLLKADDQVEIDIANSIWHRNDFAIKREFLRLNNNYLNSQVTALNFKDKSAKDIINAWVAANTRDRILEIVDRIDDDHFMFLINAVYFKGIWAAEFNEQMTMKQPFYLADGKVKQVMTMHKTANMAYAENDLFSAVELPYGNGNFSMLVLLPQKGISVDELVSQLDTDMWNSHLRAINYTTEVNLKLPRFGFEYETELKRPLMNMKIRDAFMGERADFSGITDESIFIGRVKHKSFVEVNEKGTEAAAVTSIEFRLTTAIPQQTNFHVDRPFVFAIVEKTTGAILFLGRVMEPVEL
jgi:serine protease inhibitor